MTRKTIRDYMTPAPHTIGVEQPLAVAAALMQAHHIRHLPVLHGGKLVGILSERDVQLVSGLPSIDPAVITVEDAMSDQVFTVTPETSLAEVAAEMAAHKYGAAVVTQGARITGIFTTIDALHALVDAGASLPRRAQGR